MTHSSQFTDKNLRSRVGFRLHDDLGCGRQGHTAPSQDDSKRVHPRQCHASHDPHDLMIPGEGGAKGGRGEGEERRPVVIPAL